MTRFIKRSSQTIGHPPGSLVHVGDKKTGKGHPFHAIKLRGFPLEGKKTPFGVLNSFSMRFIPQLKKLGISRLDLH